MMLKKNHIREALVEELEKAKEVLYESTSMHLDLICEALELRCGGKFTFKGRSIYYGKERVASIKTVIEPCVDMKCVGIYAYTILIKGEKEIFEEAKKRYNRLMMDYCIEHATIGTNFSENTEDWNLRDMVSEAQYHLDCCFEEGNANSEASNIEYLMDTYGVDRDIAKLDHADWLRKVRRFRAFIKAYEGAVKDIKCAQGHCSCYD